MDKKWVLHTFCTCWSLPVVVGHILGVDHSYKTLFCELFLLVWSFVFVFGSEKVELGEAVRSIY